MNNDIPAADALECADGLTGKTVIVPDLDAAAVVLRVGNADALDVRVIDGDPDSPTIADLIEAACDPDRADRSDAEGYLHERVRPVVLDGAGNVDEEATTNADWRSWHEA